MGFAMPRLYGGHHSRKFYTRLNVARNVGSVLISEAVCTRLL